MLRVYETFAGVGSQNTALRKVLGNNYEIVGITEWDMYAVISYFALNNETNFLLYNKYNDISNEEIIEFLEKEDYSIDSKNLCSNIKRQPIEFLRKLYIAHNELNNHPNIMNLKGEKIKDLDVDLLTYSFPCQDLSVAGKGAGISKENDQTRSGLLWEIERILDEIVEMDSTKLPKYLLMENVVGLFSKKHVDDYNIWKNKLKKLGYETFDGIINASDYGSAQARRRVFAMSIKKEEIPDELKKIKVKNIDKIIKDIIHKENIETAEIRNIKSCLCLNYDQLKYKHEADLATPNHTKSRYMMWYKEKHLVQPVVDEKVIEFDTQYLESGQENFLKAYREKLVKNNIKKINIYEKNVKFNCEINKNIKFFPTLTTKQDRWNNGGMIAYNKKDLSKKNIVKKSLFRFLTPREAFLIMGFEEENIQRVIDLDISQEKLYRQAGNSIAVEALVAIFSVFLRKEINE